MLWFDLLLQILNLFPLLSLQFLFYLSVFLFFFLFFIRSLDFYNIIYPTISKENLPLFSLLGFHTHQIKKISVLPMFHSFLCQHTRLVLDLLQFLALPKLFLALLLLKFIWYSKTKLNPSFLYLSYIQRLCLWNIQRFLKPHSVFNHLIKQYLKEQCLAQYTLSCVALGNHFISNCKRKTDRNFSKSDDICFPSLSKYFSSATVISFFNFFVLIRIIADVLLFIQNIIKVLSSVVIIFI